MDTKQERLNEFVPAETILKYKEKEIKRYQRRNTMLCATVKRLQKSIHAILTDPEVKKAIAREYVMREKNKMQAMVEKRLHEARTDRDRLLEKIVKLQEQLAEYQMRDCSGNSFADMLPIAV